jgi:uncharacterized protein YkwD
LNAIEQHCFDLTNLQRRRGRLRALAADAPLSAAARRHSDDMLRRRFFGHINPDGQTPRDRVAVAAGRRVIASAENLWMRSGAVSPAALPHVIEEAIAQLMASAVHRDNIMSVLYTHLGVGIAVTPSEVRVTQLFARF